MECQAKVLDDTKINSPLNGKGASYVSKRYYKSGDDEYDQSNASYEKGQVAFISPGNRKKVITILRNH